MYHYLVGTQNYFLIYKGETGLGISTYTDSDWASNPEDCKLQTGHFFTITGSMFSWTSRAQRIIALFSTEAKYMALLDCSQQCVWIRSILIENSMEFLLDYSMK